MSLLEVWHEATDHSLEAEDYGVDSFSLTLLDSEYLYLGYRKPVSEFYVSVSTANTNTSIMSVEYYNGSGFTAVSDLIDRSKGFERSDFFKWSKNQTNEAETTINSKEMYWYRLSVDVSTSAMVVKGLNLLFSDDNMIKEDEPHLLSSDFYPSGESSYVLFHQAARNELLQRLRNKGYAVKNSAGSQSDLNIFDLHDRTQLSMASKYLVLSKIHFNLSDAIDDKYFQKYRAYKEMSDDAFNVFFLSLDSNDDGEESNAEKAGFTSGLIQRV